MGHSGAKRRVVRWLALLTALAVPAAACGGGSGTVDRDVLPEPDARVIGRSVDAPLTAGEKTLVEFDDGNGNAVAEPARGYRLGLRQNESVVSSTLAARLPADQVVEASFSTEGSPLDAAFGVVCRAKSNDTYYRLGVGNDGTYAIARVQDGASTVLTGDGKWVRDRRLQSTPGFFLVRGECRGEDLTLFANNAVVAAAKDSALDGPGRAGVFVETFAEPNATVTVNHVAARAYPDRAAVPDDTIVPWDDFVRRQKVAKGCTLLDPESARAPGAPRYVTRCGPALYLSYSDPRAAERAFRRILAATDADLEPTARLPNCRVRTGVVGPFPTAGRVACLDLGDTTAVVWFNENASVVGLARIRDGARAAWRGYGPGWPAFVR
jgi:hypothetical protein